MFEPKDTGESFSFGLIIILLISLILATLYFQTQRIIKTIEETPKETIKLIHTEINP